MTNIGKCQICNAPTFWFPGDGAMYQHKCCSRACLRKLYVSLAELSETLASRARSVGERLGFESGASAWRSLAADLEPTVVEIQTVTDTPEREWANGYAERNAI